MSDTTEPTLFDLPISPDDFGVLLPPAELRRIKFSALDFSTARRAIIEYIRTYYPNDFNDFVASNGIVMICEVVSAVIAKMAMRGDILFNEGFMPTCTTEEALSNHLALINQRIRRQTPAVVDIEIALDNPVITAIEIDPGTRLTARGPDDKPIVYEVFRAPGDFIGKIVIPAGKRGVIAYGIEGAFAAPTTFISSGGPNQVVSITDPDVLEAPILVRVATGNDGEDWTPIYGPIELYGPNDKVVEVTFGGDRVGFRFGDDNHGKSLTSGQTVSISYRVGGGVRGRVGAAQLSESRQVTPLPPANAPVTVIMRNPVPSQGGTDKESMAEAKRRAPRDFATHKSIVTADDYAQAASTFAHPVYGSVAKAMATIRTGWNANLVEIFVLAIGGAGKMVTPSIGLKRALTTYFEDLNVLTDRVSILDGGIRAVDIDMTVVVSKNADATVVKGRVEQAVTDFFAVTNWEMGEPLHISNLVEVVEAVDGVAYVDMFKPADNIIPYDPRAGGGTVGESGIAFNELIVEGSRQIRYYYEKGRYSGHQHNGE